MKKVLLMTVLCIFLMQGIGWGKEKIDKKDLNPKYYTGKSYKFNVPDYSLFQKQVTDLAKRVGVKPVEKGDNYGRYVLGGENDKYYDMFELMLGILNKMDEKLKQFNEEISK